jgi:secreted Zn-dependent insulinase-like peptidase
VLRQSYYVVQFLSSQRNGGSSGWNGSTGGDYTRFDYDILCTSLEKSLEMFVSYFVEPLIPLSLIEKELSVVDSGESYHGSLIHHR